MTAAPTTCVNHRRRPRAATCGVCGNAICTECVVHTGVGVKCRSCTGVKSTKPGKGARDDASAPPRAAASSVGRKRWAVPVAAAGVVVLALAAFGLASRGSGPATVNEDLGLAPAAGGPVERQTEFVGAGGLRIAGTLTLPPLAEGRTAPAVLIIPGMGALDRNGPVAAEPPDALRDALLTTVSGLGTAVIDPLYRDLSEMLAKEGIASFRYEKRGTKGAALPEGQKLSFDDEVADARAALDLLSKRQEVANPIVLLGHDTGGVVAMRLAPGNGRIRGVVAISTPAKRMSEAFAADLTRSRGPEVGEAFRAAASTLAATGKAPSPGTLPEILRPVFASGQDAYLASVLALDPVAEVGNVPVAVLLVRGGADPAIAAADVTRMQSSLRIGGQVITGNPTANRNLTLPGEGHVHSSSAAAPTIPRDTDTRAAVAGWVRVQVGA